MTNEQLRMQMLSGLITESEYKAKLEELGGGMSPKQVLRRAIVTKLNKYYNSVDDEEIKQKLKDKFNPTIDGILYNRYGDDINNTPMVDLLDDLDDYLKGVVQPEIDRYMPKESLNENFVGMGMVGNIFDREKADYEMAFEYFTKGDLVKEEMGEDLDLNQEYLTLNNTVSNIVEKLQEMGVDFDPESLVKPYQEFLGNLRNILSSDQMPSDTQWFK
jgi:hypothetical protein